MRLFSGTVIPSVILLAMAAPHSLAAQDADISGGVPVRMVVTVEGKHDTTPPPVTGDDVMVWQDKQRVRLTGWTPLQGGHGALQLWILIDDALEAQVSNQFGDIRKFIDAQPPNTEIGIGYIRNGTVEPAAPLGTDHARAEKALRIPMGISGGAVSPYISLTELIKKWPAGSTRREVLMVTSGIDLYFGPGPDDPYLEEAIDRAQRAGVIVDSIYYGAFGHMGHDMWRINWGQNDLAQLCDATGGEAYWEGTINPVSFAPFLNDLNRRLANQYELTFLARPGKKSQLQPVRLTTEIPHVSLVAAPRVWVPAGE